MDQQTIDYYNEHGEAVAKRYEEGGEGIASLFPFIFSAGQRVVDIGSGSGRNLAALRKLGLEAVGLEPSEVLRRQAVKLHPQLVDRLVSGSLPGDLSGLRSTRYDGALLSAVIMHIPDSELFESVFALRELLKEDGVVVVSFATKRGDTKRSHAGEQRDDKGRLMMLRSAPRIRLLFERLGFLLESEYESSDSDGRRGAQWTTMVFRSTGKTAPRVVDRIESILNNGRTASTFNFALARALCDLALTGYNTVSWTSGGRVGVPLSALSDLWIRYYWPLFEPRRIIPQIAGESKGAKPVAFRAAVTALVDHYRMQGGLGAFVSDSLKGSLATDAAKLHTAALRKVGATILSGPVQQGGGAKGHREFTYDEKQGTVLIDPDLWREIVLMAHWIQDAVVLRWAEMTMSLALAEDGLSVGGVLQRLLESTSPLRSDHEIRYVYEERLPLECIWSGRRLGSSFEIGHALPFALWQDSSWWNLFPAAPKVNSEKRDRLPTLALVQRRQEAIISSWELLRAASPSRFALDSARLTGRPLDLESGSWQHTLFSTFVEAIEYTAASRGVPRWEP